MLSRPGIHQREAMRFYPVTPARSFFPSLRAALMAAGSVAATGLMLAQAPTVPTPAPTTQTSADGSTTTTTSTTVDSTGKPVQSVSTSHVFGRGKKKEDKVTASKDTKKNEKKARMADSLIGVDSKLPDKQLFDKAQVAIKKGHFDVGRLDLQTMLNTYPDSQYQLRAKLAVADSWYREGGTAALTQAEQEYRDFCVFFPNAPEAAEAQMRIGDIYFKQMDKPDRDYAKALHAEEEYRRMITDYPDSKLVPEAKQRLREVQEVLATREANIAQYYATRENWAAVIARYQTVVDTYPLYSHMDDTLIGIGDAYEAQAKYIRGLKLPEGPKAKLEQLYDGRAIDAYREVVLKHSAAPHVEDARDRLAALNAPIPTPTKEEVAASEALENSRRNYRMSDRVKFLILHQPDTVLTAQTGEPEMTDPKVTTAPAILAKVQGDFTAALTPAAAAAPGTAAPATAVATPSPADTPAQPAAPAAPLALSDVGTADSTGSAPAANTFTPSSPSTPTPSGNSLGVEILTPGVRAATPADAPAATGTPDPNYGLKAVGPANATPLPPTERAADAPDRPNTITTATPPAAAAPAKGKAKPAFDKDDESSSKHKKKKGIKKIIPLPS
jgi:outer membrane protein assembly factor BamD